MTADDCCPNGVCMKPPGVVQVGFYSAPGRYYFPQENWPGTVCPLLERAEERDQPEKVDRADDHPAEVLPSGLLVLLVHTTSCGEKGVPTLRRDGWIRTTDESGDSVSRRGPFPAARLYEPERRQQSETDENRGRRLACPTA